MRLTYLMVDNFKQFEHVELTFQPGFTVVKGANEAGKSTLQAAILVALFMDPKAPDDVLDDFTRWGQSERFRLRLEFEDQDTYFVLNKDFQDGTLSLHWQSGDGIEQGRTEDFTEALNSIGNRLGAMTIDTYVNTACVRSEEVSSLPAATAPLSQRLQAKMTGSRQADASEVLRAIDRELAAMSAGSLRRSTDTGPLRMTRDRVDALSKMRTTMAGRLDDYQENLNLLVRRRDDLRTLENEARVWTEQIELSDRVQTIEEECALLEEHGMLLEHNEMHGDVGNLAEKLGQVEYGALSSALERAGAMERQIQDARRREGEINERLAGMLLHHLQTGSAGSRLPLVILGAVIMCGGVAAAIFTHMYVLGLIALVGVALVVLGARAGKPVQAQDTRDVSEELHQITARIRSLREESQRLLTAYGLNSVDELAAVVRELRPIGEAHNARRRRIAQMLGDRRSADRTEQLRQVRQEIAVRQEQVAALAPLRMSPEDYRRADERLLAARGVREEQMREVYRLEGELSAYEVNSEMLAALDEELAVEQVRLSRIERRRKGLEGARAGLRAALSETLLQAGNAFRTGLAEYLSQITSGRYNQVEAWIDTDGLHLLVFAAGSPKPVEADKLSRATQDQIYLAARLTLLQLACEGRKPPLLLDDPFVNYDDARLSRTAELLNKLDTAHQIILFTCTNRYDQHATSLIDLVAATRSPATVGAP
jgi:DNA repair exonuclease SbcCD ATPase subunit